MLIHARLSTKFYYFALKYACVLHNVLPVRDLVDKEGNMTTPHFMFRGHKPNIAHLRTFGAPSIRKRYGKKQESGARSKSKWDLQQGIRCIYLGLPDNQAGWSFWTPGTTKTVVSYDAIFDESFSSAVHNNRHHPSMDQYPSGP